MKKKYRSAFIAAYILTILAGVIWHAGGVSAQDTIKLTVNSHTTSTTTMNNMQPGDETNSEYTIINAGSEGFNYYVDFKFISGDAELYDILQMTLEKEGVIIYSGVMSEAAGRVTIGSLAGGEQSVIQMDVIFPWEAGNEYQGKTTTVAFEFSASGGPEPSAEPSPSPTATATAQPTPEPTPTATTTPTIEPTSTPTATATPEASPTATASPTTTPTDSPTTTASPTATAVATPGQSTTPTPSPTPTASTVVDEISVTEAPIPLGGGDNEPTASPSAGSQTTSATPQPSNEIALPDDELPLGAPEVGNKLPNTAEPWYNLILASLAIAVLSVIIMRRLKSKK
ncbi:hypothetical protein [Paenibacillus odorifer]|uniref:hypothetical protein n=1 Tax=Paenibacillus odorifer TaxID=189426 RepID=UPI000BA10F2F|nr:hypothetical protein [Paenibacillus odorifer]OZQ78904.1 hypothetical protein CA596_02585 [Paenibacillus odorifer]